MVVDGNTPLKHWDFDLNWFGGSYVRLLGLYLGHSLSEQQDCALGIPERRDAHHWAGVPRAPIAFVND